MLKKRKLKEKKVSKKYKPKQPNTAWSLMTSKLLFSKNLLEFTKSKMNQIILYLFSKQSRKTMKMSILDLNIMGKWFGSQKTFLR
jgi:hypothetical protein